MPSAGQGLLRAETPEAFVQALQPLLDTPDHAAALGVRARAYVEQGFSWQAHLSGIDHDLANLQDAAITRSLETAVHV